MKKEHILIVDDEEMHRSYLSQILADGGHYVTVAEDGRKALMAMEDSIASGLGFDLLLTDIMMPDMSGMELIDKLREIGISTPVMAITAHGHTDMVIQLMRKNCADFIEKPVKPSYLLKRIRAVLDARKTKPEFGTSPQWTTTDEKDGSYKEKYQELRTQMDSAVKAFSEITGSGDRKGRVPVAVFHRPLFELGGDIADIKNTSAGCDVLIADVSGHDAGASYHAVLIKSFFHENCRSDIDGLEFFRLLNRQLLKTGNEERMVTALFLRLNLDEMYGQFVSAGHPPLLRITGSGEWTDFKQISGDVLGIREDVIFTEERFLLSCRDRFFLYTDGLTNCRRIDSYSGKTEKLGILGLKEIIRRYRHLSLTKMMKETESSISQSGYFPDDDLLFIALDVPQDDYK